MSDEVKEITEIKVKRGKNYDEDGEIIGTYNRRHIVFFPKKTYGEVEPGSKVRVKIIPTGNTDRCNNMMYRAEPADTEYTNKWKDNGDGTASLVTISENWKLETAQEGVVETKQLEKRENADRAYTESEYDLFWGESVDDSMVVESAVEVTPVEQEVVKDGKLKWEQVDEKRKTQEDQLRPIEEVKPKKRGEWWRHRLEAEYSDELEVRLQTKYRQGDTEQTLRHSESWSELPDWLQSQLALPLCDCGRKRRDPQLEDGYSHCKLCRSEETCERCGEQTEITVIGDRMVCNDCESYERQEQLITDLLDEEDLQAIADEAARLRQANAVEGEAGEKILESGLNHINSDYTRDRILKRWSGYEQYYFTSSGVYGSHLPPQALSILEHIPNSRGNSFVELFAWIVDADFYVRQQDRDVQPNLSKSDVESVKSKLEDSKPVLADRLRESEDKRKQAINCLKEARKTLPDWSSVQKELQRAEDLLQSEEQPYSEVLEQIERAEEVAEKQQKEREELAFLLEELKNNKEVNEPFKEAKRIRDFAEEAVKAGLQVGKDRQEVISLLEGELNARYGRARRQKQLKQVLYPLAEKDLGQRLLGFRRRRDLDRWLKGAIKWLKNKPSTQERKVDQESEDADLDLEEADLSELFGGRAQVDE